ncbi:hypothetical protein CYQ88_06220 [Hydrogenovibrio sp. SC-1]|uniref:HvfB family MNIO-type RiPP peptide maturase n=1 Tax=Hydrogenovibrio sp. SC-1 TaxID=2065820 RepID=UPI000C7CE77E|nr:DUF692 domain-containing protein [Hydrogenovibrio sp. SC-1]PLA74473.1 hypothetical protein CYQ88_06220 [Hydrogenovibrio sp. SC-1]
MTATSSSSFASPRVTGVGLGLRRDFFDEILATPDFPVDFLEVAPENWVRFGGRQGRALRQLSERYPLVCHGLSLDIGGPHPLDEDFLLELKAFFKTHQVPLYTEHLSYCGDSGHLYDLMPIPFTEDAVDYVAKRIRHVQDVLEQPLGIENVSFYALPTNELSEVEFINAVATEADCGLLLDVNNTYVNSINHQQYDPIAFIEAMPTERLMYLHMAGHFDEADDLKIDTHGEAVKPVVWDLLDQTYAVHGVQPTLLERDFNIPPLADLQLEINQIRKSQQAQGADNV